MPSLLGVDDLWHFAIANTATWGDFVLAMRTASHPPLAYLPIRAFLGLGTDPWLVRMSSFLASVAGIAACWLVLRVATRSVWFPVMGATVVAVLPSLVGHATEARSYGLKLLFVWMALLFVVRLRSAASSRLADHAGLALANVGALMSHYGAIFHVASVVGVVAVPACLAAGAHRRRRAVVIATIHAVPIALGVGAFLWHFSGGIPVYPHTRIASYEGPLLDPGGVARYLARATYTFLGALGPPPVGAVLLAGWLAGLASFARRREARGLAADVALYALIVVTAIAAAGLIGQYPFSGDRHTSVAVPGIIVASLLAGYEFRGRLWWLRGASGAVAGTILLALAVAATVRQGTIAAPRRFDDAPLRAVLRDGRVGVVMNREAWSTLSWWLFDGEPQRSLDPSGRVVGFGARRAYVAWHRSSLGRSVADCLASHAECWVTLAVIRPEDLETARGFLSARQVADGYLISEAPLATQQIEFFRIVTLRARRAP